MAFQHYSNVFPEINSGLFLFFLFRFVVLVFCQMTMILNGYGDEVPELYNKTHFHTTCGVPLFSIRSCSPVVLIFHWAPALIGPYENSRFCEKEQCGMVVSTSHYSHASIISLGIKATLNLAEPYHLAIVYFSNCSSHPLPLRSALRHETSSSCLSYFREGPKSNIICSILHV